ncbi:FAD-binding protein [Muricoccus radiodurans]|uniref:FAD-binding protein n=1 Tax=Muricoccus radiodurans TaxID=2231721 RepID=UPI003CF25A82
MPSARPGCAPPVRRVSSDSSRCSSGTARKAAAKPMRTTPTSGSAAQPPGTLVERVFAWGRIAPAAGPVARPFFVDEVAPALARPSLPGASRLCHGLGRSYGDVALNSGGLTVYTTCLDRLIAANWEAGVVRAEAGTSLDALLRVVLPRGWSVPVLPGSRFVTLGGAVANDVHGKNHLTAGSFGAHVTRIGLLRGDRAIEVTPGGPLFAATLGGLGLTGAILWVELRLARVASSLLETETRPIACLAEYFAAMEDSAARWEHRVAWIDCLSSTEGRGLFTRARHAPSGVLEPPRRPHLSLPMDAPSFALNGLTVRAFNWVYRRFGAIGARPQRLEDFFFPLDGIANWNRMYGKRGFFQHQSVVPRANAREAVRALLAETARAGEGSFLVVLKEFGPRRSEGVLSFPMEGTTLAVDLPNRGDSTRRLLGRMADIALEAGGRIYPAKDAAMTPDQFRRSFPEWEHVEEQREPGFDSDFWRRVTGRRGCAE